MAPRIFFLFDILILNYFSKYETIETHARALLALISLVIGRVIRIIALSFYLIPVECVKPNCRGVVPGVPGVPWHPQIFRLSAIPVLHSYFLFL